MKQCTKCGKKKSLDNFGVDRSRKDGHNPWCKDCCHDSRRRIRAADPDKSLAYNRKYYNEHYAKESKRMQLWRGLNLGKLCEYQSARRARQKGNGGKFTNKEWEDLKKKYNYTCLCCGKREPEIRLTHDHVKPLVIGGSNGIENIQPLCKPCNSAKGAKHIDYR